MHRGHTAPQGCQTGIRLVPVATLGCAGACVVVSHCSLGPCPAFVPMNRDYGGVGCPWLSGSLWPGHCLPDLRRPTRGRRTTPTRG